MPSECVVHIVDDSAAVLRALDRLLRTANYTVRCYERPSDFLEAAVAGRPLLAGSGNGRASAIASVAAQGGRDGPMQDLGLVGCG